MDSAFLVANTDGCQELPEDASGFLLGRAATGPQVAPLVSSTPVLPESAGHFCDVMDFKHWMMLG